MVSRCSHRYVSSLKSQQNGHVQPPYPHTPQAVYFYLFGLYRRQASQDIVFAGRDNVIGRQRSLILVVVLTK